MPTDLPEITIAAAERALELARVQHKKARIMRARKESDESRARFERTEQDMKYWMDVVKRVRGKVRTR